MIASMTPDLQQALHLLFADRIFDASGPLTYRIGMADIQKEFRKKAMLFHPDRAELLGQSKGLLEEKFKQISHAYGILKSELDDKYLILGPDASVRPSDDSARSASFHDTARRKPQPPFDRKPPVRPEAGKKDFGRGAARVQDNQGKRFFFNGMVPRRRLRLGEYLFYRRAIAWQTLINALVWQYRVRPRLGQIALELNYIVRQDIMNVLKHKAFKEPFGRAAVRLGFLDDYQRFVLLGRQRRYNRPLGKFFLDFRILSEIKLDRYVQENRIHNIQYDKRFQGP